MWLFFILFLVLLVVLVLVLVLLLLVFLVHDAVHGEYSGRVLAVWAGVVRSVGGSRLRSDTGFSLRFGRHLC